MISLVDEKVNIAWYQISFNVSQYGMRNIYVEISEGESRHEKFINP